jgi:hypothetical protein
VTGRSVVTFDRISHLPSACSSAFANSAITSVLIPNAFREFRAKAGPAGSAGETGQFQSAPRRLLQARAQRPESNDLEDVHLPGHTFNAAGPRSLNTK